MAKGQLTPSLQGSRNFLCFKQRGLGLRRQGFHLLAGNVLAKRPAGWQRTLLLSDKGCGNGVWEFGRFQKRVGLYQIGFGQFQERLPVRLDDVFARVPLMLDGHPLQRVDELLGGGRVALLPGRQIEGGHRLQQAV